MGIVVMIWIVHNASGLASKKMIFMIFMNV
jgi:hypothetical protein